MVKVVVGDIKKFLKEYVGLEVVKEIEEMDDNKMIELEEALKLLNKYYTPETAMFFKIALDI